MVDCERDAQVQPGTLTSLLSKCRESRKLVLLIVAIGLLLDNMLLTSVVPIIPTFLYNLNHPNETLKKLEIDDNISPNNYNIELSSIASNLSKLITSGMSEQCRAELQELIVPSRVELTTDSVLSESHKNSRHKELVEENYEVGIMFASKPIVQAITNLFVGPLTAKIGYSLPLFFGLILLFFSTMIFALGSSFFTLFVARSMQGVGSAFTTVAGMGLLAHKYTDDRERGNVMAIALGGLALGVLIGPPFGGIMYEFVGQSSPFVTLAMLALLDGCLQLLVLQPEIVKQEEKGASLRTLIQDPYILLAAGAITFANSGIAMLEPSLPLWMMDTMDSSSWEQGAVFLPASISYLCGTNLFGPLGHKIGRWLTSLIGILMIGFALLAIPFATSMAGLIIPNGMIGFAIGMVDSSMMPMLGHLVDIRHSSVYGSVYAIGDVALCVGYIIGPAMAGSLVQYFGFDGLCMTSALVCFLFAPAMFALRDPPSSVERIELNECQMSASADYQTMNYSKYSRFSIDSGTTPEFEQFQQQQQQQPPPPRKASSTNPFEK